MFEFILFFFAFLIIFVITVILIQEMFQIRDDARENKDLLFFKVCKHCGHFNFKKQTFCLKCGWKL